MKREFFKRLLNVILHVLSMGNSFLSGFHRWVVCKSGFDKNYWLWLH